MLFVVAADCSGSVGICRLVASTEERHLEIFDLSSAWIEVDVAWLETRPGGCLCGAVDAEQKWLMDSKRG